MGGQENDCGNIVYACLFSDVIAIELNNYYVVGSFFHFGDSLKSACL